VAIAQGRLKDADAALDLALANQSQIEIRKKDLESNAAQVVRAEVSLKAAQDRLKDTLVTAPISGTILQKFVEEGQVIASASPLSTAAPPWLPWPI